MSARRLRQPKGDIPPYVWKRGDFVEVVPRTSLWPGWEDKTDIIAVVRSSGDETARGSASVFGWKIVNGQLERHAPPPEPRPEAEPRPDKEPT